MRPVFVTGIGTDVGKSIVSAIITEALYADYWKPVQAGFSEGTDSEWIRSVVSNEVTIVHPETYRLTMPASPHVAAREEGISIDLDKIYLDYLAIKGSSPIVIEGAGGLMVPLNDQEFIIDLIKKLDATVVIVSRNYLGSINHSLLTAEVCRAHQINVAGWIFNDHYLDYESEIASWSGFPVIGSIPYDQSINKEFIKEQADSIRASINSLLC